MREDAFKLGPVHLLQKPAGDDEGRVRGVTTRREGVGRGILDHVEPGGGDAQADRERLGDVAEHLLFVGSELACPALRQDELVSGEIGDPRRADGDEERDRHDRDTAPAGEVLADEIREHDDDEHERDEEDGGAHAVRRGGVVDRDSRRRWS